MKIYDELEFRGIICQSTNEEKVKKILNNEKSVFYLGFDPTANSLHVGSFVQLSVISKLQRCGHSPICLFGGGTGFIGDPSGKNSMRKLISKEEIEHNVSCFKKQISRFLDISKVKFVNNADWLCGLNYIEFLRDIGKYFNVNKMLTYDCYRNRLQDGLTLMELNYMIMQSYDFLYLYKNYGCKIQIGGSDQWSNIISGVDLVRKKENAEVFGLTTNLLTKSDGKKMGKTEKGAIWLDAEKTSPYEFYQYWRNVQDSDVIKCVKMLTDINIETIREFENFKGNQLNDVKEILAYELTKSVHGEQEAEKSRKASEEIFKSGGISAEIPTKNLDSSSFEDEIGIVDVLFLSGIVSSKSEGRRLVQQNGISVNGNLVDLEFKLNKQDLKSGVIVKKGKKNYIRVVLS